MNNGTVTPSNNNVYARVGSRFEPIGTYAEQNVQQIIEKNISPGQMVPLYRDVADIVRSITLGIAGILANSDEAFIQDRRLQRQMRRDPDVRSPLLERQMAVCQLEWTIEPDPSTPDGLMEQAQKDAKAIETGLRTNMPLIHEFRRNLQEALFYGPAAVNIITSRTSMGTYPVEWNPLQPDSIAFTREGRMGLYVGYTYSGETFPGLDNGRVRLFTARERASIVFHRVMIEAPLYDEFRDARVLYSGRGLRDIIWHFWLLKQTVLQNWAARAQFDAYGLREWRYPSGNDDGLEAVKNIARNAQGAVDVFLPRDEGVEPDTYDFEFHDTAGSGTSSKIYADLIKGYLAGQIKELILGQTATTEATNTGLGSDLATRHAETFQRRIKWDSMTEEDTLSRELVQRLHRMNFGEKPYRLVWKNAVDRVDPEQFMAAVEKAYNIGARISQQQVRDVLGMTEPIDLDDTLEKPEVDMLGPNDSNVMAQ